MNAQGRLPRRAFAFLLLTPLACALAEGCKPGLIKQAEKLAGQIKAESGTPQKLRSWFIEVQTSAASDGQRPKQLAVPASLGSTWARGTTAYPTWADDGSLETITMTRDGFEFVTIGAPSAKPKDFRLAQNKGEPLSNYGQVAEGIYAWVPNK